MVAEQKECFGQWGQIEGGHLECHRVCGDERYRCMTQQSKVQGECDCPYKASCHIPRQHLQSQFIKERDGKIEDCWFYKKLKPIYEAKEEGEKVEKG